MFWAIARSRQLSAEEMNNRAHFGQRETTPVSRSQNITAERQLNNQQGTTSSTSADQSDRMALDNEKSKSTPKNKAKSKDAKTSQRRTSEAVDWKLQEALQAERNRVFAQYQNRGAQRDASAGR